MQRNVEHEYEQDPLQRVSSLLGSHFDSSFWNKFLQTRGRQELLTQIKDLETELSEASSEDAKENVRKAYSNFDY